VISLVTIVPICEWRADRGSRFKSDEGDRAAVEVEAENMASRLRSGGMSARLSFQVKY
jgi:hypothetical protein